MRSPIIMRRFVCAFPPPLAPDGQITARRANPCPAPPRKIFRFRRRANQRYQLAPSFPGQEGRIAIVTNAGGDAVDAAASARNGVAGRVSRERYRRAGRTALIPPSLKLRRTGTKPVEAFGVDGCVRQNRVVPTPVAGAKLSVAHSIRPDRNAIKPAATVTRRIRRRGERGISRKAIARGMPECLR
jgi:hypothetical protein